MTKIGYLIGFISVFTFYQIQLIYPQALKGYGETCDSRGGEVCNTANMLTCVNGICNCLNPNDMLFDEMTNQCLSTVGSHCGERIHSIQQIEVKNGIKKKRQKQITVNTSCVEDAVCVDDTCTCMDNYFPSGQICVKKLQYDGKCSTSDQCSSSFSYPLMCQDNRCQCNPNVQVYNGSHCVNLVGTDCNLATTQNECTAKAVCNRHGKCECSDGKPTSKRTCSLGYGAKCLKDQCGDTTFACINGVCACRNPKHMKYFDSYGECRGIVSGPCTDNGGSGGSRNFILKCVPNAECVDKRFYSECKCREHFVQTADGLCAPGIGQTCTKDECDPITPLFCKNGKCDCQDEYTVWDAHAKKCVGLVGSRCQIVDKDQCVEFATCIQVNPKVAGLCVCDKYATTNHENRTCAYAGCKVC